MLTILWHDEESKGYTDHIPEDWLFYGHKKEGTHDVIGPRLGRHQARCSITIDGTTVYLNYEPFEKFNSKQEMHLGVLRIQFTTQARDSVSRVSWKQKDKKIFESCSTSVAMAPDSPEDFEKEVAASSELSSDERRKRLVAAAKKPQKIRITSVAYRRNPDVIAEVLFIADRAGGTCQRCKKLPFKRVGTDVTYLEVHHKIRLADGGDDTLENAIALCPNCHREAHYG